MPRTPPSASSGRMVVGLLVVLAIAVAGYFALGMPGMDHSGGGADPEMDGMEHPRKIGIASR